MDQLITQLIGQGGLGIIAGVAIWIAYKKDQELKQVNEARLEDQKKHHTSTTKLLKETVERYHESQHELSATLTALVEYNNQEDA